MLFCYVPVSFMQISVSGALHMCLVYVSGFYLDILYVNNQHIRMHCHKVLLHYLRTHECAVDLAR